MKYHLTLTGIFFAGLLWSGVAPRDRFTWFLEVAPALIALAALALTYRRFRFTNLVYTLILVHAGILMVGGHWTYAEVPLFNWIRDTFHHARNNYDKIGHFTQGFVPALVTRELLVRLGVVLRRGWLGFVVVTVCMSISVLYEFFEWWTALGTGEAAEAFLGTQGYVWDTQSDMLWCTIGAIAAVTLLGRLHDRWLERSRPPKSP